MSMDTTMAWRNIWRNPRRSILTMSAIAFASLLLILMLSFQFGTYDTMINSSVKLQTGHLQVQAEGYEEKRKINLMVTDPETVRTVLDSVAGVNAYTFRANAFSLVSTGERTYPAVVVGVDPPGEAKVSTLKQLIRRGDYLLEDDLNTAVLGDQLARQLKVGPGDELTLLGQGRSGSMAATVVKIKGIYRSGQSMFDQTRIYIPMRHFQDVYHMRGAVHEVVINTSSLDQVPQVKEDILVGLQASGQDHSLVVLDWQKLLPGLYQGIQIDLASGVVFYLILIVVITFSILNTFLMTIFERTREFGILMAIGITPNRLTKLLLLESTTMALLGVASGVLAGCLIVGYFQVYGLDLSGATELLSQFGLTGMIYPKLSLVTIASGPLTVLLITFLAALYPALKVRRFTPVEAMVHV